ncbi:CU044_5270 family protein [Amycolatopsis sp. NPDC021455]|uniref:CU044_5270 family protein n=1 Tax=Amycolatopsis sp. NPDC021455 TaxID=3154901 RepID=UPI0033EF4905
MTEHDVVDAALRHYHHAGPRPDPADLARIRGAVLARTAAARRPARLRGVSVAVAASVVAATTIALWPESPPPAPSATPAGPDAGAEAITAAGSVSATVDLIVRRVANAEPLDLRDGGGYLYTADRSVSVQSATGPDGPAHYVTEDVTERWSVVGEGTAPKLMRLTRGLNARPLTPADAAKLARYGADYTKVTTSTYEPSSHPKLAEAPSPPGLANPTPAYLASLPTDPGGLLAVLRASVDAKGTDADRQVFKAGAALATTTDALLPPGLRVALYQALARVPGVERIPGRVDLAGRPGVAIAHTHDGKRTEIVIDPATSRTLGYRMVTTAALDGMAPGTVVYSVTKNQKIVEHLGDL